LRRTTATATVNRAAIQIGRYSSSVKRPIVPTTLFWRSARGDSWASWPATSGRPLVIVGIPNHMKATSARPTPTSQRVEGIRRHIHSE
jgi:hypothetical protein